MSKFYKEEKKVNESKFVAEHCEDLTFEMYISDIKASGCDVTSMNELRDEFESAGLQVTGENGPEGVIMKVIASDPEQCESVYNILMGCGCDEKYVDFIMNNPAQHDGKSFADVEEEIPFESVNNKKQKNAILESIKKGGCGCAPKKLNESMEDSLYYHELYNSEASEPEEIQQIKSLIQKASRDPRVKLFAHTFNDYAGSVDSIGLIVRPEDLERVKRAYPQGQYMMEPEKNYRYFSSGEVVPSSCREDLDLYNYDDYYDGYYDEFIKLKNALEIIGFLYESAKPKVKFPFGAPKKLNESEEGPYVGKYFNIFVPDSKKLEVAKSLYNHPNLEFVECKKEYPDGIFKCYAILTQNHLIAEKIASTFNEKVFPIRLPSKGVNIRPISPKELENAEDGMVNESAKPRRIKRLNESMNDSLYFYELFNSETFVEDADINKVIEEIKGAARDPRLKLFQMETSDYAGDILQIGVLVNPRDLHYVTRRYPQLSEYAFPVDATYRFFEDGQVDPESCDKGTGEKYTYEDFNKFISAGYCSLDEAIEEIENALENIGYLDESAKPGVKSPFGSVKVNGKKLGECGKGELRQMLREAKQELKELKKEEKSLGEGCGKRAKNKIAKKIEKAEKLVEILEEEIKFNPKKAGAVNEAKTLWKEFTKWSKLYEAESEEEEEEEEKPEDSKEETEEKEDEVEEAELEAILLTVKNIEKVNQNLIDAGIPEEHIQMIPDEEDPKQGKIRVDAEDAIILKEYLATLGIDLEEEIGAELISDEEDDEKEDDSEEDEEKKKDDDKEVNDDDVEVSAEDIFGDM